MILPRRTRVPHASSGRMRIGPYVIPLGGDVVVAIDGTVVVSRADLTVYLETSTVVEQTARLTVVRNGSQLVIPVVLGARPAASQRHGSVRHPHKTDTGMLVCIHACVRFSNHQGLRRAGHEEDKHENPSDQPYRP